MARRFFSVDLETPLLMPPSIQEGVSEDDMARFVVDAVSLVEEDCCRINWRGSGSEQYPPHMMMSLSMGKPPPWLLFDPTQTPSSAVT